MRTILGKKHFDRNPHPMRPYPDNGLHVINILLDEVEYEVLQTMYKYGQMSDVQGEQTEGFTLADEEKDWLDMVFKQAVSNLKSAAKPYAVNKSKYASDELIDRPREHDIVFRSGDGWTGSPEQVNSFAHDYTVAYILSKWWYQIGNTTQGSLYNTTADNSMRSYKSELNSYDIEPIMMENL